MLKAVVMAFCLILGSNPSWVLAQEILSESERDAIIKATLESLDVSSIPVDLTTAPVTTYKPQVITPILPPAPRIRLSAADLQPVIESDYPEELPLNTSSARDLRGGPAENTRKWSKPVTSLAKSILGDLPVNVSGILHTGFGINSQGDLIFNRANADLNERNFRLLSGNQLNNRINTFDPGIYSSLKVILDAAVTSSLNAHMNLTFDPWSYVGKSDELNLTDSFGDKVKMQYLFWGNTGYTVNRIAFTQLLGDGFAIPEMKVKDDIIPATTLRSNFGASLNVPATKIKTTYQPVREAWLDYKPAENFSLRLFPMAYENQALTSDDPLKLSNNKSSWEESPWLLAWRPGQLESTADFFKGGWDRSLSFFTRDSAGTHLTALRGVTMDVNPNGDTSLKAQIATPKTLWQEYEDVNSIPAAARLKHYMGDTAYVGGLTSMHLGYNGHKTDAASFVQSIDAGVIPIDGIKLLGQYSRSQSRYDKTTPDYESEKKGEAMYLSLIGSTNSHEMIKKDYFGLLPNNKNDDFFKTRLYWGKMEEGFESTLSNYHETRKDQFWSRHLTFYPSTYRYMPGLQPTSSEYDLEPFGLGDGLDYNRTAYGWRGDTALLDGRLTNTTNVFRSMTSDRRDHVETQARTQVGYKWTDRLSTKALYIYDALPKTTEGFDPFIVDGVTGKPLINTAVEGGQDPSLQTVSLGARYQATDWAALNGVWEHTNDSTRGSDNFPRGVFNSSSFSLYNENGNTYRQVLPFLYSQGHFDQAPYEYFNIFKTGLELHPTEPWHIYIDYTRNPNEFAGNIDDNINHLGFETSYTPNPKLGFFARYTLSRWINLNKLVEDNVTDFQSYHNVFLEARFLPDPKSMLSLQYGVGPAYNVATSTTDPKLTYYSTTVLDTQHLIRLMYDHKF